MSVVLTIPERNSCNVEHAAKPKPGDYWEEMFSPVALVLEVGAFHVSGWRAFV